MKKYAFILVLLITMISAQIVNAQNSVTITTNPSPATICVGSNIILTAVKSGGIVQSTGYVWNTGAIGSQITLSSLPVGSHTYTVTTTFLSQTPTTVVTSVTVTVNPIPAPVITAGGSLNICAGNSITLTSSLSTNCQWYLNGAILTGATSATYTTTIAGSYSVAETVGGCSGESAGTVVTVNPLPDAGFTPNTLLDQCNDGITPFVANLTGPNYTYQWYRSVNPINGGNPGVLVGTADTYIPIEGDYNYSLKITNTTTMCSSTW